MAHAPDGVGGHGGSLLATSFPMNGITTFKADDVILVGVHSVNTNGVFTTVSSITGGGLTFIKRKSLQQTVASNRYELSLWYAVAANPLTNVTLTVNLSNGANGGAAGVVWAWSGLNTSNIWDALPSASATGTTSNPTVNASTSQANSTIIGVLGDYVTQSAGAGFTFDIQNGADEANVNPGFEHEFVTSIQSNAAVNFVGSAQNWIIIADAFVGAPPPDPDPIGSGGGHSRKTVRIIASGDPTHAQKTVNIRTAAPGDPDHQFPTHYQAFAADVATAPPNTIPTYKDSGVQNNPLFETIIIVGYTGPS